MNVQHGFLSHSSESDFRFFFPGFHAAASKELFTFMLLKWIKFLLFFKNYSLHELSAETRYTLFTYV